MQQNCARSLEDVRTSIDQVDRQIVALLAERAHYVTQAARLKKTQAEVQAPDRVEQVVAKVRALAEELALDPALVERVYRTMIAEFISAELREHAQAQQTLTPPRSSPA